MADLLLAPEQAMFAAEALEKAQRLIRAVADIVANASDGLSLKEASLIATLADTASEALEDAQAVHEALTRTAQDDAPGLSPVKSKASQHHDFGTVEARPLWELAGPACNAADDARDLVIVMQRALGTYSLGFGPDELFALWTIAGKVQEEVTEAADRCKALMRCLDAPAFAAEAAGA